MLEQHEFTHSLPWLHGKLNLGTEINLYNLLCDLRAGDWKKYYDRWYLKGRLIHEPKEPLKLVQQQINKVLLSKFPPPEASFGFSGGSCLEAVKTHTGYASVLMLDLRDAFSQVTHYGVYQALFGGQCSQNKKKFSHYVSVMIADLCTVGGGEWVKSLKRSYGGFLPQGPSTSPRLFDLVMEKELDKNMLKWAARRNFRYCRYADNLFFSSQHPVFPPKQRAIILSEVGKNFKYHKLRQVDGGEMCQMLGLNLRPDSVANTREYKRTLRGALHHLEYALNHELPYEEAWALVKGYWGFAVKDTLPAALSDKFYALQKQIHTLEWGW